MKESPVGPVDSAGRGEVIMEAILRTEPACQELPRWVTEGTENPLTEPFSVGILRIDLPVFCAARRFYDERKSHFDEPMREVFKERLARVCLFFRRFQPKDIGPRDIREYRLHRAWEGTSQGELRCELATLRSLLNYVYEKEIETK